MNHPIFQVYGAVESSYSFETKQYTLTDTLTFVEASACFTTAEEARAYAAQFPKSYGVVGTSLSGSPEFSGYVTIKASLSRDGINHGKNEAGIARVRKFVKKLTSLGGSWNFVKQDWSNAAAIPLLQRELGIEVLGVVARA